MPELTVTGMRVVREVAARGSFTGAARALGYTQSAISRQVSLTEQAAGTELFERLPRGVRPTAHGAVLIQRIGSILDRIDSAMLELEGLGKTLSDRLTLGAFPTALAALVPRALARVRAEHPGVSVKLHEGGTIAQLRRVRAGHTQIAVVAAGGGLEYDLDDLEVDLLMHGTPRLIVSATHRFAERDWVNVTELGDETWIVGEADRSGPQFGPWPTLDHDVTIAHSTRDLTARVGLVAAGLGVAVIPSLLIPALPPGCAPSRSRTPAPSAARSSSQPFPIARRAPTPSSALCTTKRPSFARPRDRARSKNRRVVVSAPTTALRVRGGEAGERATTSHQGAGRRRREHEG